MRILESSVLTETEKYCRKGGIRANLQKKGGEKKRMNTESSTEKAKPCYVRTNGIDRFIGNYTAESFAAILEVMDLETEKKEHLEPQDEGDKMIARLPRRL